MSIETRIEKLETEAAVMCPEPLPLPAATQRLYNRVFGSPPSAAHLAGVLTVQGLPAAEAIAKAETLFADLAEDNLPNRAMYDPAVREAMLSASEKEFGTDGTKPAGKSPKLPGAEELT